MNASSPAAEHAKKLLASGSNSEAVRVLSDAVQRGDPTATYLYALWNVYGQPIPRDFGAARRLFARAGDGGHAESARTYAVFVAIGAGGPADWQMARMLLEAAGKNDPIAASQSELLAAMQLEPNGTPSLVPDIEPLSGSPRLGLVRSIFTTDECSHIMKLSAPIMIPSVVADPTTGLQTPNPIRTSDGTVLGPIQQDLVIHALNLRIASVTATREEQGEPLSVLRYRPGQQYRRHHDCLPGEANQRIITLIAYLNDGYEGGATQFSAIDLKVRGQIGDAILFANVLHDGRVDQRSQHAGLPVNEGEKWVCTRWIRRAEFDPWGMRRFR